MSQTYEAFLLNVERETVVKLDDTHAMYAIVAVLAKEKNAMPPRKHALVQGLVKLLAVDPGSVRRARFSAIHQVTAQLVGQPKFITSVLRRARVDQDGEVTIATLCNLVRFSVLCLVLEVSPL